ncbi:MAG: restriction endonuclease subunit S [SAR324 cluster bacterium]|nr:restriction endonuclease subunit S [SAR324 cluster bacterium]
MSSSPNKYLGSVPSGWEVKSIKQIFDFYPTASFPRSKLIENGDVRYIHYGDIHTKYDRLLDLKDDRIPYVSSELGKKYEKLQDGDVVLSDASEDWEGVGKSIEIINAKSNDGIAGLHTLHLRPKGGFLCLGIKGYLLNTHDASTAIKRLATGIKVYGISKSSLQKVELCFPSCTSEQEAITGILSKVDEAIVAVEKSIKAAERLKKSLIQNLLTGKLKPDGTWRSEDDFYVDEKFGKVPKGWAIDRIKNLTNRVTDGEHLSPDFQSSGAYLLSAEDVFDDGISLEKAKFVRPHDCQKFRKRCDPDFGDVLIVSRGASIGRTCKVDQNVEFCLIGKCYPHQAKR